MSNFLKPLHPAFLGLLLLAGTAAAAPAPAPLLIDAAELSAYKAAYQRGSAAEAQEVKALLSQADQALKRGPYAVTKKAQLPPSGDKHDFLSQAPYFWPDPSKPDGKPYIQKDGLVNPETKAIPDDQELSGLCRDVKTLALAYYFSADERYAAHAAGLLRAFFLDAGTRMNPNLNFGQGIPGTTNGRSYGIIQTRHLVNVPDALALLGGSKAVDKALTAGVQEWFRQYTQWLTTSKLGREEAATKNNHGTFYDVQVVDFALFTGDQALARRTLEQQSLPRVAQQIGPDGAQPLELARTRPWNYTGMNLQGWAQLAVLARRAGVDLWHYRTADGRGLQPAVAWFRPYLLREKQMDKADVTPAGNTLVLSVYSRAGREYPALEADKILALYPDFNRTPWAL
ncbi:alginate lyase family protein [Hymenobacter sp. 15J16-1T3B]|uniref:alginate lyase family protein n=1 Tax=Hymenobacter sp. 15J16-1T3B TaxID=2886941 RepID=UPI001D0FDB5B|nr:alginate lyase family protein [Hymenobacter sp. 15J16-1T3B]MCC3159781.1 alginate lyase family protein [Hymenobacter sp. 15J16-1T3B]